MIEVSEMVGATPNTTKFVEPTSGNTATALTFVAATKGYDITLIMPESMSAERCKMLKFLGATLELASAEKGMDGAIAMAKEFLKNGYVQLGQFVNSANILVHEYTTAIQILQDTNNDVDVFIAGVGTGGTVIGVGKILKKKNPNVKIIAEEPEDNPVLSGYTQDSRKIQGIGACFIASNYNGDVVDEVMPIDNEKAFAMSPELAKIEDVAVGISSDATLAAILEFAFRPEMENKRIVIIMVLSAERYLTTALFEA